MYVQIDIKSIAEFIHVYLNVWINNFNSSDIWSKINMHIKCVIEMKVIQRGLIILQHQYTVQQTEQLFIPVSDIQAWSRH